MEQIWQDYKQSPMRPEIQDRRFNCDSRRWPTTFRNTFAAINEITELMIIVIMSHSLVVSTKKKNLLELAVDSVMVEANLVAKFAKCGGILHWTQFYQ